MVKFATNLPAKMVAAATAFGVGASVSRAERAVGTQKPEYAIRARPRMCVTYGSAEQRQSQPR